MNFYGRPSKVAVVEKAADYQNIYGTRRSNEEHIRWPF